MSTLDAIEQQAANWIVKLGDPLCTREQLAQLDAWLAEHPDHRRTFQEMERLWSGRRRFIDRERRDTERPSKAAYAGALPVEALRQHGDRVQAYLIRQVSRAEAEDLVQNVFLEVLMRRKPATPIVDPVRLLLGIARDVLQKYSRAKARFPENRYVWRDPRDRPDDFPTHDPTFDEAQSLDLSSRLASAAEGCLSEREWMVLSLWSEGHTHKEVAALLGTGAENVPYFLKEALRKLKAYLDEQSDVKQGDLR